MIESDPLPNVQERISPIRSAVQERPRVAICPVVMRAWTRRPRCERALKLGDATGLQRLAVSRK